MAEAVINSFGRGHRRNDGRSDVRGRRRQRGVARQSGHGQDSGIQPGLMPCGLVLV
ncbi:MAG: hypothetical protein ACI9DC_004957 [Gammaproteobacteria bacterium]|jgi:hypothetical protein